MTVQKIESAEYTPLEDKAGDGIIEIELRDLFKPYLLGTSHCTKIVIWWDTGAHEYDESVRVYAIEENEDSDDFINTAEQWYDCDLEEAMEFVREEIV